MSDSQTPKRGPGRPRVYDYDAIRAFAADGAATHGQIAQQFGCSTATVAKALREQG